MDRPIKHRDAVNWPEIFDLIASEYSYTWDQFTGMTYKMLNACLGSIAKRSHNKIVVQASMHGIKMDLFVQVKPPSEKIIEAARVNAYKILEKDRASKNGKRN